MVTIVLSEQDVENFITNDALSLSEDTTLNGQDLVAISGCTSGQVLYNDNGNWTCKDFVGLLDNDGDGVLLKVNWMIMTALPIKQNNDCDGNASSDDCDDFDPNSLTTTEDTDCDGILNENDLDADGDKACDDAGTPIQ